MRRISITGGAGFIGSHLTDNLLKAGHRVEVIDNLNSGHVSNLTELNENPNLKLHRVDISCWEDMDGIFEGVDYVFHLAGMADIVPSIESPQKYFKTNVEGTLNVLRSAHKSGVSKLVYAASSSCYGLPATFPTSETCDIKPMYPYALTKYMGEQLVMHWDQIYKLPSISLRLFNVFGPRSRATGAYGAVFGVFLAQKLARKPFTVVGDGEQTRDFTFVSDVVNAMVVAAESDVRGQIFNVGSGGTYSINSIVELLGGDVTYIPKRPGEPDTTYADISKIKHMLGWEPEVKFSDGVIIMKEHIEDWIGAPVWDESTIADATEVWFKYLSR